MKIRNLICLSIFLCLMASGVGYGADVSAIFYEDIHYEGASREEKGEVEREDLHDIDWNDKPESLKVKPCYKVTLWGDTNFTTGEGEDTFFCGDYPDLDTIGDKLANDVSSYKIERAFDIIEIFPTRGSPGDTFKIKGTGFNHPGVQQVKIGRCEAKHSLSKDLDDFVGSLYDATIEVTVPSGCASGKIKVKSDSGCKVESTEEFTICPGITSIEAKDPNSDGVLSTDPLKVLPGTLLTVHGTGFTNVTDVMIGGVSVNDFDSNPSEIELEVGQVSGTVIVKTAACEVESEDYVTVPGPGYAYFDKNGNNLPTSDLNIPDNAVKRVDQRAGRTEYVLKIDHEQGPSEGYPDNFGDPSPKVGKHWYIEGSSVDISIDGVVYEPGRQTRHVLTGYKTEENGAVSFDGDEGSEKSNFTVEIDDYKEIGFIWKKQYKLEVSAMPAEMEDALYIWNDGRAEAGLGAGVFWFDSGLSITSIAMDACLKVEGYRNNLTNTTDNATGDFYNPKHGLPEKLGQQVKVTLDQPIQIIWQYEAHNYELEVVIGEAIDFESSDIGISDEVLERTNTEAPPVTPPTSGGQQEGEDLFFWSPADKKLYPLIGNRTFQVEWQSTSDSKCEQKLITTITTKWPDKPHYNHVADTPPVPLDPDETDQWAFKSLKYAQMDAAVSNDLKFTASKPGWSTLLFTTTPEGETAVGDVNTESAYVRAVKTRTWSQNKTEDDATIGEEIIGTEHDRQVPHNGFIFWEKARYNAEIYDRETMQGPIFPVNREGKDLVESGTIIIAAGEWPGQKTTEAEISHYSVVKDSEKKDDDMLVIWYELVDGISWPYKPVKYNCDWPTDPKRIVIASQVGSEGMDANGKPQSYPDMDGNDQNYLDPRRYKDVKIYNQPDEDKPGYNPNEEHALIAPSFRHSAMSPKPVAVFALRNDLNEAFAGAEYKTSKPLVLTQYFDDVLGKYGMMPFEVETQDPQCDYTFEYNMKAGDPVTAPYPLNTVMGVAPPKETFGEKWDTNSSGKERDTNSSRNAYWEDHKGQPWAISGAGKRLHIDEAAKVEGSTDPVKYNLSVEGEPLTVSNYYLVKVSDEAGPVGTFKFQAGYNVNKRGNRGVYVNGIDIEEDALSFMVEIADPQITGMPKFELFECEKHPQIKAYFWYPLASTFWYKKVPSSWENPEKEWNDANKSPGDPVAWLPTGKIEESDGFPADMVKEEEKKDKATEVGYNTIWPEETPVLKAGETLTFAGGEYRADHPQTPEGLPMVLAWAAGQVIFDDLNPDMDPDEFDSSLVRLAQVLEERTVSLPVGDMPVALQPAGGKVKSEGGRWYFQELHSGLKKRVFYDPLTEELGIRGFINGKTLGDNDLTASPPSVYVLQPNILTHTEYQTIYNLKGGNGGFQKAVNYLYNETRDPAHIQTDEPQTTTPDGEKDITSDPIAIGTVDYNVGIGNATEELGNYKTTLFDAQFDSICGSLHSLCPACGFDDICDELRDNGEPSGIKKYPTMALGPGLALIPNAALLDPANSSIEEGYVTLAENNHPALGSLPVALHIIKVVKDKYRGAIKPIYSDNVFDEKITLRHTADFGANPEDIEYQWYYRGEDGEKEPPPGNPPEETGKWDAFSGGDGPEIEITGAGAAQLSDNLFFCRYRHTNSNPEDPTSWSNWAGAANSRPPKEGEDPADTYQAQLAEGWVKRVVNGINPFEARIDEFYSSDSPATYSSMIQQAGPRFEGAVAFNPDKDVIENIGLIELYRTVLNRAKTLSINLEGSDDSSGIYTALLLAASRISGFYTLLGNEAYADALDPTIGFGTDSVEYGSLAPTIFTFMNQVPTLLDEELALLRGRAEEGARPVYNRLLWNFTKAEGEAAYALSYNIADVNRDGFIDEADARRLYPQGHGDAWGHYLSALKGYYDLLNHPGFEWESRSEKFQIEGVVLDVDYLDERKFAETAAAKAKTGKEIVNLTYRSKYVEDPDGQWQGYQDTDPDRAWGLEGWSRRAGMGTLFDWATANAILPPEDAEHEGIGKVDRTTVPELQEIAAQARQIQGEYDQASTGLNPLGLATDAVPFDVNPARMIPGAYNEATLFEQVCERAMKAMGNAQIAFDHANDLKNRIRQVANDTETFTQQVIVQDRDYRNRLIEIFGTPYEGTIGSGKVYPAGYKGPDYFLYMYVDVNEVNGDTVPAPSDAITGYFTPQSRGFKDESGEDFGAETISDAFSHFFDTDLAESAVTSTDFSGQLEIKFPVSAGKYSFHAPEGWGIRRSPGEIQQSLIELVKAEADLQMALADYAGLMLDIQVAVDLLEARSDLHVEELQIGGEAISAVRAFNMSILAKNKIASGMETVAGKIEGISDAAIEALPKVVGLASDPSGPARLVLKTAEIAASTSLKISAKALKIGAEVLASEKEIYLMKKDSKLKKANYKYDVQQQLKEIEVLMGNEAPMRLAVFKAREHMRQISEKFRSVLGRGLRLMEERKAFNAKVAAKTQGERYQDMAFRVNMNEALSKYRTLFDQAARYAYLAAKAYDYETNLADRDPASAQPLLTEIVKKRTLGQYQGGRYIVGQGGLGDILARLRANYDTLKAQMGFNNPQAETGRFSLRYEKFRVLQGADHDDEWRSVLQEHRVDNLWAVPEFRQYCRPFTPETEGPQPGIVIPFETNVIFGQNFFGWPLGGGDHAYDPTNFATKVRSVGLWFDGYDNSQLSETPRAYLVPAGMDVMLVPDSTEMDAREWTVVEQKLPVPLPVGDSDLANPDWVPSLDALDGSMAEIRKFSSFRAYHDSGYFDASEMTYDSRLVGRSVWNTRWMLIIPGGTFNYDAAYGLDRFIQTATDIRLFFETYAISGS